MRLKKTKRAYSTLAGNIMHLNPAPYQSLEKALKILLAFESRNREMGTVELSNILGLHRSTVGRMLKILTAYQFLQQNPQTKKFSLGPTNILLAKSLKKSLKSDLVQIVKPYLDELRDTLQDTTIFETLSLENWIGLIAVEAVGYNRGGYNAENYRRRRLPCRVGIEEDGKRDLFPFRV